MRINDIQNFEYILRRGVSPLKSNENDLNVLHMAIKLEKLEFLSYLLEGDYAACEKTETYDNVI